MWLAIDFAEQPARHQFADAPARHRRIVGNNGQISLVLPHQLVNHTFGVPTPMNPPIMRLAPSGIMAAAPSIAIVCMARPPLI